MFEDHAFQQGFDDLLLFGGKLGDSFELEPEIAIGAGSSAPKINTSAELARLIETPDLHTAIGLRDRALMETLYATGVRHAEAHRLDLYDVDTAAQRLIVRLGKGQRDRIVPLTETAVHWLTRYLTVARPQLAAGRRRLKRKRSQSSATAPGPIWIASTPALWLAVTGRRLSYVMLAQRIRHYALQAEVKASVHTFRHCCATHLLRGGASLRHVQQLLGHRDLNTTELYTHLELQDLKQAIQYHSAEPKNSLAVKCDS